jgi:hypothetical protein
MQPACAIADESIETVLESSAEAEIRPLQIRKDSLAPQTRRETIIHTTRWQQRFAAFLLRLTAVA